MPSPVFVVFGAVLAVIGFVFMLFRVPVARFFRAWHERRGSRAAPAQTPGLVFAVGAWSFVGGLLLAVGTR